MQDNKPAHGGDKVVVAGMVEREQGTGEEAVTIDEAIQMLGVSRRTVFKYISQGKLRRWWRRAGSRAVIPVADIRELFAPVPSRPGPEHEALVKKP